MNAIFQPMVGNAGVLGGSPRGAADISAPWQMVEGAWVFMPEPANLWDTPRIASEPAPDDINHLWEDIFGASGDGDVFQYHTGTKDMIRDFESADDQIDLSAYGLTFAELQNRISDLGWGTEIDLSDLPGGVPTDRIVIRSMSIDDLCEDNFIL